MALSYNTQIDATLRDLQAFAQSSGDSEPKVLTGTRVSARTAAPSLSCVG